MCVYVFIYTYIYIYICMYNYIYRYRYMYIFIYIYVRMYVCMYVCMTTNKNQVVIICTSIKSSYCIPLIQQMFVNVSVLEGEGVGFVRVWVEAPRH